MPHDVRAAWNLKSNDIALKLVGGSDRSIRVKEFPPQNMTRFPEVRPDGEIHARCCTRFGVGLEGQ